MTQVSHCMQNASAHDRMIAIDVLRGFALLGILIMNIVSFSFPSVAYYNPFPYTVSSTIDPLIYCIGHVIADQKFMGIFSILFGASTLLFLQSAIRKGKKPMRLFYTRNLWLLGIGTLHFQFIWYGDILSTYAMCALILYFFKSMSARTQFMLGLTLYCIPSICNVLTFAYVVDELPSEDQKAFIHYWHPPQEELNQEIQVYQQGSYQQQMEHRESMFSASARTTSGVVGQDILGMLSLLDFFLRAFGMMLVGMALFSWNIFSGTLPKSFYRSMMLYGFGIGIPLCIGGLMLLDYHDWHWKYGVLLGRVPNNLATPFIVSGYIGLIMLWSSSTRLSGLKKRLQAVGQTALTCYLAESVIMSFIFYSFGLGYFGTLSRAWYLLIIPVTWAILLILLPIWMQTFRYGPVEWAWRSVTYLQRIPIKK